MSLPQKVLGISAHMIISLILLLIFFILCFPIFNFNFNIIYLIFSFLAFLFYFPNLFIFISLGIIGLIDSNNLLSVYIPISDTF